MKLFYCEKWCLSVISVWWLCFILDFTQKHETVSVWCLKIINTVCFLLGTKNRSETFWKQFYLLKKGNEGDTWIMGLVKKLGKMFHEEVGISRGIDINVNAHSRECIVCHFRYFSGMNFRFQPKVCDCCHDFIIEVTNFNKVAIVSVFYRMYFLK